MSLPSTTRSSPEFVAIVPRSRWLFSNLMEMSREAAISTQVNRREVTITVLLKRGSGEICFSKQTILKQAGSLRQCKLDPINILPRSESEIELQVKKMEPVIRDKIAKLLDVFDSVANEGHVELRLVFKNSIITGARITENEGISY